MNPEDVLSIAQQGNPKFIAAIINRTTEAYGIFVRVARRGSCLYVLLEGDVANQQEALVLFIQTSLQKLQVRPIASAIIYGRQKGQTDMDWSDHIKIPPITVLSGPVSQAIPPFNPSPQLSPPLSTQHPPSLTQDLASHPLDGEPPADPNPAKTPLVPPLDERAGRVTSRQDPLEEEAIAKVNTIDMPSGEVASSLLSDMRTTEEPPQKPTTPPINLQDIFDSNIQTPLLRTQENIEDSDQPKDVIPSDEGQIKRRSPNLLSSNQDELAQEDLQVGNNQQSMSTLGMSTLNNSETQGKTIDPANAPSQSLVMDCDPSSITAKFNTLVGPSELSQGPAPLGANALNQDHPHVFEPESASSTTLFPESDEPALESHPDAERPLDVDPDPKDAPSLELASETGASPPLMDEPLKIPTARPVSLAPSNAPDEYSTTDQQDSEVRTCKPGDALAEQNDADSATYTPLDVPEESSEGVESEACEAPDTLNEAQEVTNKTDDAVVDESLDIGAGETHDAVDVLEEEAEIAESETCDAVDEAPGIVESETCDAVDEAPGIVESETYDAVDEAPEIAESETYDAVNESPDIVESETHDGGIDTLAEQPDIVESEMRDVSNGTIEPVESETHDALEEAQDVTEKTNDVLDVLDESPDIVEGETRDVLDENKSDESETSESPAEQPLENPDLYSGPDLDNVDLNAFIRHPEALVLLVFTIAFFIWQTYLAILNDAAPEGMLTASKLAKRLGVNPSTISRRKEKAGFEEWAQSIDPDGLAWSYQDGFFIPHMGDHL